MRTFDDHEILAAAAILALTIGVMLFFIAFSNGCTRPLTDLDRQITKDAGKVVEGIFEKSTELKGRNGSEDASSHEENENGGTGR